MVEWENWICPMLAMLTFSTMLSDFAACEGLKMIVMWWRFDACWKNGAAVVNVDWATLWHLQLEPLLWTSHCNIGLKKLVNNPFRNCVIAVDLISWRVLKFEFYIGFKLWSLLLLFVDRRKDYTITCSNKYTFCFRFVLFHFSCAMLEMCFTFVVPGGVTTVMFIMFLVTFQSWEKFIFENGVVVFRSCKNVESIVICTFSFYTLYSSTLLLLVWTVAGSARVSSCSS